ncbi:MAG: nucleoside monophosphate kinase [Patescibacteria group bacterium]
MIILLTGPQGSGKGTQGQRLAADLGMPFVSAGELLREEIATGSELGATIKSIIDPGNMVPPEIIRGLFDRRLARDDAKRGLIIDSYPRNLDQLAVLQKNLVPDVVVVLDISDDVGVERLGGRFQCPEGHIWNMRTHPPKVDGVCDQDGLSLSQRDDETEAAIRRRLSLYHDWTEPMIAKMQERGLRVERVDALRAIEDVYKTIRGLIAT